MLSNLVCLDGDGGGDLIRVAVREYIYLPGVVI